ncbi:MAG: hypothetical protein ABI396_12955 [Ktedonobacteraceae bacterium]
MQTLTGQRTTNNVGTQSRTIAIIAILLFALAGLISGFAVGAFVRPNQTHQASNPNQPINAPVQGKTGASTSTPTPTRPELLGEPIINNVQYSENADGTTGYTFTAQAVDKQQQPVHKAGITCKMWLTRDGKVNNNMPANRLKAINTLAQPFPKEVANALNFNSTTPQVQQCAAGQGSWNYTLSSSLGSGAYYLVVLTDWSGVHYNWKWAQIIVKK